LDGFNAIAYNDLMSALPGSIRPLAARVVRLGVLALALWNLGRAAALWRQEDWLTGLPLTPDPRLRLAIATLWAALFLFSAAGLRRWSWPRRLIPLLLAFYGVYELGMIFVFAPLPPALLPVFVYIAFIGFAAWALWPPVTGSTLQPRHKGGR
jgi:hypothetical protein